MTFYPTDVLKMRMQFKSAFALVFLTAYLIAAFFIFFEAVVPSYRTESTNEDFAVDSTYYTDFAASLRSGTGGPTGLKALLAVPNYWTPVSISFVLNSTFLEMLLNLVIFAVSIYILGRAFPVSIATLVFLLLLNATTMTSLLCVNKEILDLFCLSLFLYSQTKRNRGVLLLALCLALINRYEFCIVMLGYLLARSRLNPWRGRRFTTLLLLVIALNFMMPAIASHELSRRFQEAESGGAIRALDELQLHYLYIVAVIPKIADNLFSAIVNPMVWNTPTSWLLINMLDNLAYVVLLLIVAAKRQLTLRNDLIYFGAMGAILIAQSLVYQPRYFYFLYVLLCLQAAHKGPRGPAIAPRDDLHRELSYA